MASNVETKETKTVDADGIKLNDYELVIVVSPDATEEKLEARVQNVSQYVASHGGAVGNVDRWGKRKMAYSIKGSVEGTYVLYRFKLPATASRELEANLKIYEDVLRHLLVKIEP